MTGCVILASSLVALMVQQGATASAGLPPPPPCTTGALVGGTYCDMGSFIGCRDRSCQLNGEQKCAATTMSACALEVAKDCDKTPACVAFSIMNISTWHGSKWQGFIYELARTTGCVLQGSPDKEWTYFVRAKPGWPVPSPGGCHAPPKPTPPQPPPPPPPNAAGPFACKPGMGPCNPSPNWPVTYRMNESLMLMGFGTNKSGSGTDLVPLGYPASRWSIFDIDWDTGKPSWGAARPQNCSELMAKQVADMAASVQPSEQPSVPKRYMTYRNFVKALPLLTSVREIMNDPSYDVWFVNFSTVVQANHSLSHVPPCEANMTIGACSAANFHGVSTGGGCVDEVLQPPHCSHLYHDQVLMPESGTAGCGPTGRCDTGRVPQGNYLWDFRQANVTVKGVKMVDWFIEKYMFAEIDGLGNPLISGFYIGKS